MAFITIITGSHEFRDDFRYFYNAYCKQQLYKYNIDGVIFKKTRFDRVIITKKGEVIYLPPVIATLGYNKFSCTQTMGSGKTILGMEHLARIHHNGGNTDANLSVAWFKHNQSKPVKKWLPSINSLEDFEKSNRTTVLFDDIKHTISRWNAEESEFISAIVNQSRKEMLNIIITTQRVINFVPPNIREVCTNYEIPYVTIRDQRVSSPDDMGMPLEMEVLNISANGVFIGFGLFNGMVCDGNVILPTIKLLESYSTLEVAVDLKTGETKPVDATDKDIKVEPYKGYDNEKVVFDKLTGYVGELKHLAAENNNTHLADIELNNGKRYLIDVVGVGGKGQKKTLNTGHKHIAEWVEKIKKIKAVPLYAYSTSNMIFFIKGENLIGKAGNIALSKELKRRSHSCEFFFTNRSM